ncbi:hypothetical protein D1007_20538 [Hordeum vulgare]|nr:hypothetical protein D1007_20538 [Hordeum vulgare]
MPTNLITTPRNQENTRKLALAARVFILSNSVRGPKAPGKVRKTEVMMVVVTEPFLGPRRVDRLLEPLDAAGDDDGAFVRVPVLLPRLSEQLQDQGVPEQRHRHREPPRRLALLLSAHPERRASFGDRRRRQRLHVRGVVAGGDAGEEVAARFFLVPLH